MSRFGGGYYSYSLNKNELNLRDEFSDVVITSKRIE